MNVKVVNHFYVAGDFLITMATGASQEVLRLVTTPEDASAFGQATAHSVKDFVESRMNNRPGKNPPIIFKVDPSERPKGLWIVHGIQEVLIDDQS